LTMASSKQSLTRHANRLTNRQPDLWIYRGPTRITDSSKQSGPVWYSSKQWVDAKVWKTGASTWPCLDSQDISAI
jgi:hypothetical protein